MLAAEQISFVPAREIDPLVGADGCLARVMEQVRQVAHRDTSVLLLGETGVGKGLIASIIHNLSRRSGGPFVNVNCGAIPETLLDSELFGHEKGAFTGAIVQKKGRFERAHKGTIFLDEIGEMPLPAQIHLLNVLEDREVERVGGNQTFPVDIRIISATHQNLETMVDIGGFRKDLWFRLNVFPIMIPPLRYRKQDIPALVHYFIRKKARTLNLPVVPVPEESCLRTLMGYHWPGNVRELDNLVERALVQHQGKKFDLASLIPGRGPEEKSAGSIVPFDSFLSLDQAIRIHIRKALSSSKGKINGPGGAARLLDIHPNTLRKRMDKLEIVYKKIHRTGVFSV